MAIYAHKLGSDERVFVAGLGRPGPAGENGFSPTVAVTAIPGGHRITITDAEGPHTFDIMDGQEGTGDGVTYTAGNGVQITDTDGGGKQISLDADAAGAIQQVLNGEVEGTPGPQGPQGPKGDTGDTGPQGQPGSANIVLTTQAAYDAMTSRDTTTLYAIPEEE